jgi:hypothetical protein
MTEQILPGSRWRGGEDFFQVIELVQLEDHLWVYYRRERDCLEFSCWIDSFLSRFTTTPQDSRSPGLFGSLL